MDKQVVKELIQKELNEVNLVQELDNLLNNVEKQKQLNSDYNDLNNILQAGGHASANASNIILKYLNPI